MNMSNIDVKRLNRVNIYRAFLKHDGITKPELSTQMGISLPTITQNANELTNQGLLCETGTQASTGGRKASILAPCINARVAVGVDITQNHIGFACVNLRGELQKHVRIVQPFSNNRDYYRLVAEKTIEFIRESEIDPEILIGIGVSLPGIVSEEGKALLYSHLLAVNEPVEIDFSGMMPVKFQLFNDASAACAAEQWSSHNRENFTFVSLSNSVGGAIVVRGQILQGDTQRSGEIGHMCLVPGGRPCYCGGTGHFDSYGSALVLAKHAGGKLEDFFEEMNNGNQDFAAIFEEYLNYLARMVCNLRMLMDYDIVLGGYVGSFMAPYLDTLRDKVSALNTFQNTAEYIQLCRYEVEASAVGAALYYIEDFIQNV